MEMTLQMIKTLSLPKAIRSAGLPLGILILMAMMVIPLPSILLDVFFTTNILVSLIILMVALHTFRPLEFSSFPTVLLFATILRLGLNVASTRIVLSEGHTGTDAAGRVIEAFGNFVIAGDYVVGIFVFAILIIINLVVITRGAGRVSEVSARFTLDAMPGKQMAIDADLNAGLLSNEEAKERRAEISRESDFYGAMDGASKFVKGDAIASILILIINIIGGLIIGVVQHDLPFDQAAQTYVVLSVGDGLVAQIPSLLLAIATAVIVTRISSNHDLTDQISNEVGMARAWLPASGVLLLVGMIPGMPNFLFILASILAATVAIYYYKKKNIQEADETEEVIEEKDSSPDKIELSEITDNSAVSLQLGYGLIQLVDEDKGGPLVNRITGVRRQLSKELGFIIPPVRIRDDLDLSSEEYTIRLGQTIVGQNKVYPDRLLAIPSANSEIKMEGIEVKDPAFGMDALWIESFNQSRAESSGYMVIAPEAVIATHLNQILNRHAGDLIGQDDVQALLDNLASTAPQLVESVVPKIIPLHQLTTILRILLTESVPISDLRQVLELLAGLNTQNLSAAELAEAVRPALAGLLIQRVAPLNQPLPVITLNSDMEQILLKAVKEQDSTSGLVLEPNFAQNMIKAIYEAYEKSTSHESSPVLVTSPILRRSLSMLLKQSIEELIVLAFTELPDNRKIKVVATIGNEEKSNK